MRRPPVPPGLETSVDRQGRRGPRNRLWKIEPDREGDGGRDLSGGGRRAPPHSAGRHARAEHRDPDVAGHRDALSVVRPALTLTPAMVGGDDQGGVVAVSGQRLKKRPDALDESIRPSRRVQVEIVPTLMRPTRLPPRGRGRERGGVRRIASTPLRRRPAEHRRSCSPSIGEIEGEGVDRPFFSVRGSGTGRRVEPTGTRLLWVLRMKGITSKVAKATTFPERRAVCSATRTRSYSGSESCCAFDPRVRGAAEDLVVGGIREEETIGQTDGTSHARIAKDLSPNRDGAQRKGIRADRRCAAEPVRYRG